MELQAFFNWGFRSLNCLNRATVKRKELQWSESLPDLPDSAVANILSFYPNMITTPMSRGISNGLLQTKKQL